MIMHHLYLICDSEHFPVGSVPQKQTLVISDLVLMSTQDDFYTRFAIFARDIVVRKDPFQLDDQYFGKTIVVVGNLGFNAFAS